MNYGRFYNSKNKKIIAKEKQIEKVALRFASLFLYNLDNNINNKLMAFPNYIDLKKKYDKLVAEWFELVYLHIKGKSKTKIEKSLKRGKVHVVEYIPYLEDFIDEDTGAVVSVERTQIIKINGKLVDRNGKPVKFQLFENKPYNY